MLRERYHRHLLAHGRKTTSWLTPFEIELRDSILRRFGLRPDDKIVVDGAFHLNNERRQRALQQGT